MTKVFLIALFAHVFLVNTMISASGPTNEGSNVVQKQQEGLPAQGNDAAPGAAPAAGAGAAGAPAS